MKKILVVDDNQSILEAIELILSNENYEVKTLLKGDETMEIAEVYVPDAIILDLLLSGKDGKDIAFELKSDEKTKNIPIIMISAHPSAAKTALKAGADDFIAKPFDIDFLLKTVGKHVKNSKAIR